jgi:hypothetical protein
VGRPAGGTGWRSLVWPTGDVVAELRTRTVRRLRTVTLIAAPVHVAHLVVFALADTTSSAERSWRTGILVAHAALLVYAVAARWAATRALRTPEGLLCRALPWVTAAVWVGAGAAIAAVDQLVTTSITPFLVGNLVAGLVLILPPMRAAWLYLAGSGGFAWLVALVQADPSVVVSNQVNGVTAAALGLGITVLQWHSEARDVVKSQRIEAQQAELEATSSSRASRPTTR